MERGDPALIPLAMGYQNNSYQFTEYLIQQDVIYPVSKGIAS